MVKKCELCGVEPAAVPDRNRMGRPIKRICSKCHAARLRGDLRYVMHVREERLRRLQESQNDAIARHDG